MSIYSKVKKKKENQKRGNKEEENQLAVRVNRIVIKCQIWL
jgi:hypothetical protein